MSKTGPLIFMNWWNKHQVIAFWIDVNGGDPALNDIIRFAAMPVNYLYERDKTRKFFSTEIRPEYPELVDPDWLSAQQISSATYSSICNVGITPYDLSEYIHQYYLKLNVQKNKYGNPTKIIPLVYNYGIFYSFMTKLLGIKNYEHMFYRWHRELLPIVTFMNDRNDCMGERVKFSKCDFDYICSQLKVPYSPKTPLDRCLQLAACMKKLTYTQNVDVI